MWSDKIYTLKRKEKHFKTWNPSWVGFMYTKGVDFTHEHFNYGGYKICFRHYLFVTNSF